MKMKIKVLSDMRTKPTELTATSFNSTMQLTEGIYGVTGERLVQIQRAI